MPAVKPEPKIGDKCPQCGGEFVEQPAPSAEQRAAAAHRENPVVLPAFLDPATEQQRAELGALYVCNRCGYRTRMKPAEAEANGAAGSRRGGRRQGAADDSAAE